MTLRISSRALAALSVCALLPLSCVGTEVGNPGTAETSIEFTQVEHGDAPGALTLPSGLTIDEAWLSFSDFQLGERGRCRSEGSTEEPEEAEVEGPIYVELISGVELPMPVELLKDSGEYCRLRMTLEGGDGEDALPSGVPDALTRASVFIRGRRADGVPFTLEADLQDTLRFQASDGQRFTLGDGLNRLFFGFDIHAWFVNVELSEAELDAEGVIRVDDSTNRDALLTFRGDFRNTARLFRDGNRNGVLEPEELEGPIALPE